MSINWNNRLIGLIEIYKKNKFHYFEKSKAIERAKLLSCFAECSIPITQLSNAIFFLQSQEILSSFNAFYRGYIFDEKKFEEFKKKWG